MCCHSVTEIVNMFLHYIDEARNGNLIIGAAGNLKRGRRPNNPPALVAERPAKIMRAQY